MSLRHNFQCFFFSSEFKNHFFEAHEPPGRVANSESPTSPPIPAGIPTPAVPTIPIAIQQLSADSRHRLLLEATPTAPVARCVPALFVPPAPPGPHHLSAPVPSSASLSSSLPQIIPEAVVCPKRVLSVSPLLS